MEARSVTARSAQDSPDVWAFALITMGGLLIMEIAPGAAVAMVIVATLIRRPVWWMPLAWGLTLLAAATAAAAFGFDHLLDRLALLFLCFAGIGLVLVARLERAAGRERVSHRCRATTLKGTPCRRPALRGSQYCHMHANQAAARSLNGEPTRAR
jgi:hypothetical protein